MRRKNVSSFLMIYQLESYVPSLLKRNKRNTGYIFSFAFWFGSDLEIEKRHEGREENANASDRRIVDSCDHWVDVLRSIFIEYYLRFW